MQFFGAIQLQPEVDTKAVTQRRCQLTGARGRADEREMRQIQPDRVGRRTFADDDINGVVLHGRVKDLLDRAVETMDLIDEQNVVFLQIRQQRCKISRFLNRWAGGDAHIYAHLVCNDGSHRRLAQTRRAIEQHVVERLAAQTRSVNADLEILLRLFLTGIIAQQARTQ